MGIALNHTIVAAKDKHASAAFLAGVLDLKVSEAAGHFVPIELSNGVTLDYDNREQVTPQHYAFMVSEAEFDAAFARIKDAGIAYWADPGHNQPGEINTRRGGRGLYFDDPDGHNMEILTSAG